MTRTNGLWVRLALASVAAMGLAACDSNMGYRVASVGSVGAGSGDDATGGGSNTNDDGSGSGGTADNGSGGSGSGGTGSGSGSGGSGSGGSGSGGTGSGGSGSGSGSGGSGSGTQNSNVLVSSGNAMIGVAGQQAELMSSAGIPGSGVVSATVSDVLDASGQTLVELGNGSTLVLDGTGGSIGDVVSIDLGKGKVVGGADGSALVGLDVLARNPSTGALATVGASTGGNLVSVTVPGSVATPGVPGTALGATVNGAATTGVGAVGTTVNTVANPATGATINGVTSVATNPVQGVVGVTGTLTTPKSPTPKPQ